MKVWGRRIERNQPLRGVMRAALAGAPRGELLREAVQELADLGAADRVGVWLEPQVNSLAHQESPETLQGFVWDAENSQTPVEWNHLSLEAPLPEELWSGTKSVEQDLEDSPERPVIGPLVGMRMALWVPIAPAGHLRGLILAGSRGKDLRISNVRAESVAAELALVIRLDDEQRQARARKSDLRATRLVLSTLGGNDATGATLSNLAESCTQRDDNGQNPGAIFAAIGIVTEKQSGSDTSASVEFCWKSGDAEWTRAIEKEPLSGIWRKALEGRRVIGNEPPAAWAQNSVARIIAFPLESGGRLLGALVVGISSRSTSLATLEQLELRAALAADVLRQRESLTQESRLLDWQREMVSNSQEPLLLLDDAGWILALSRTAREMASQPSRLEQAPSVNVQAGAHFPLLFRARHREIAESWLRNILADKPAAAGDADGSVVAELRNGVKVRLRMAASRMGNTLAIAFEPLMGAESVLCGDRAETELQCLIEWLEEGVVLFDAEENVRAMNTRFQQIAGFAPGESENLKTLDSLIRRLESQAADPQQFV
jgi:PAS domain-containing protein